MGQLNALNGTEVLLLAIILATESDLQRLEILAAERRDLLSEQILYRVLLTFLPTDVENQHALATFLQHLSQRFEDVSTLDVDIDTSTIKHISEKDKTRRIEQLRLNKLQSEDVPKVDDDLADFLIQWVYQLEATSGLAPSALDLLEKFSIDRPELRRWKDSHVVPVSRLQNEFYPGQADGLSLHTVEHLQGEHGVRTLLSFAEQTNQDPEIGRDLTAVVTPWILGANSRKRRRLNDDSSQHDTVTGWQSVNDWIFTTSGTNFELAAKAVMQWDGPFQESDNVHPDELEAKVAVRRYAQAILAIIFNAPASKSAQQYSLDGLLHKAISIISKTIPDQYDKSSLDDATKADLLRNRLTAADNPVTNPSEASFSFVESCISVHKVLESFTITLSIMAIADVVLFGTEERQKQELQRILGLIPQLTSSEISWSQVRQQLLQLQGWEDNSEPDSKSFSFFSRVPREYLETQILDSMLSAAQFSAVRDIYLNSASTTLSQSLVKDHIVSAFFQAYDNASNGNRSRGGMKRASELLNMFQPNFTDEIFDRLSHLLRATHSMSFYHLTLQHGIPFQPVNIRIQHDPISLIEKILEQNPKAYTKLDDLIDIGRNLVKANVVVDIAGHHQMTEEERIYETEHRITYLAITSALAGHDLDTAYSYITTRLSVHSSNTPSSLYTDDVSWRAAYAAAKYRPQAVSSTVHDRIAGLSKRMDLLSSALMLAPNPEPLSEILATWRRLEEEMESLRSQALDEERSFETNKQRYTGSSELPGGLPPEDIDLDSAETKRMRDRRAAAGFSPTYEEAAPMGLFDVAKGAASAFRNSAFPLGGGISRQGDFRIKSSTGAATGEPDSGMETSTNALPPARRKRDVVSGIVTGGLVSGMSWVLGAQPADSSHPQSAGNAQQDR